MADDNGPTRREFDRLWGRVDALFEKGSPQAQGLEREMRTELRVLHEHLDEIDTRVDARLSTLTKVGVGILLALLGGLISLLTALASGAIG